MNADEPPAEDRSGFYVEMLGARKASAIHEAGHCFAAYAMSGILRDTVFGVQYASGCCGDLLASFVGYYGQWEENGYAHIMESPRQKIPECPPSPGDFIFPFGLKLASAMISCAGPAAEWKFRAERALPQHTKHTAAGDRRDMHDFAAIERNGSRTDPDSYLEMAWRITQELIDEPGPWCAVNALANELDSGLFNVQPLMPRPGDYAEFVLRGEQAQAIITRALFGSGKVGKITEYELRARRLFLGLMRS
jgi:hypothetical protein